MQTPTYFLDTNVWSTLAKDEHKNVSIRLRELTSDERILIIGSGELLEEFAPIDGRGEQHFATMLDLFWSCTNGKLFLPHSEFLRAEVRKESRLSLEEALLDRPIVAELRERDWTEPVWHDVALGVGNQKSEFAMTMAGTNQEFAEAVLALGTEDETRKASRELRIDMDRINSWFRSHCAAHWSNLELQENPNTWPTASALPAVSAEFAFYIALAKRAHSERRKVRPSDLHDIIHCAHAAYTDGLVTMEKNLVLTAEHIEWPKLPIIRGEDFFNRIYETS